MYQELLEDPGTGNNYKSTTIFNQRRRWGVGGMKTQSQGSTYPSLS